MDTGLVPRTQRDARCQWTEEEMVEALALVMQGYSYDRAEAELRSRWGSAPASMTIQRWAVGNQEVTQARQQAIVDNEMHIAHAAGQLVSRALDSLHERSNDELVKHLVPLNIVLGTAVDKLIRMAPVRPAPTSPIFIFLDTGAALSPVDEP